MQLELHCTGSCGTQGAIDTAAKELAIMPQIIRSRMV